MRELFTSFENITKATFNSQALKLFKFQYENNSIYRSYCDLINVDPSEVNEINKIPFLPIQFFKTHDLNFGKSPPQIKFESSGTTGQTPSIHNVNVLNI